MVFWKSKSADPDSAWKLQNKEQKANPLYRYINLQKGGRLVEVYVDQGEEALEKVIREELEPFFYNAGKGKQISKVDMIRWKNKITAKIMGTTLVDTRPDDHVLAEFQPDQFNVYEPFHEVCWDLNQRGSVGETALHICMLLDTPIHTDIAKILLRMYPKLAVDYYEGDEYYGEGSLHLAIVNGDFEMVKLLVENGANVHLRASGRFFLPEDQKNGKTKETDFVGYAYYGEYPLAFAACFGLEEIYDYLIDHGADPNLQDSFGNTILHMLVISNQISMYSYAVKHHVRKADMEVQNNQSLTPLTLSSKLGRNDIFKEIIELQSIEIWRYSNITCSTYPIAPLDTIGEAGKTNWSSALIYITDGATDEHLEMLDGGVIKQLLDDKWKTFARRRFVERLVLASLHLLVLSVAIYTRPSSDLLGPTDTTNIVRYICEIIMSIACLTNVVLQIEEIFSQGLFGFIKNQASAPGKFIFNISCILILACIPMRFLRREGAELILLACAAPCAWAYLLFFARGIGIFGPFVIMIYKMTASDMVKFVIIFMIFLTQFSQAFYFLFKDIDNENISTFKTIDGTIMQLFQMTLGEFKYDDFNQTRISVLTKIVFFMFAILVPILLLNMLIAMMGNTYQQIISRSEKEWKRQWAKIIIVLERTFSRKDLMKFQDAYAVGLKGGKEGAKGLMVIKTSQKTRARQRKGAISNWKRLVSEIKALIKDQKMEGKSGTLDLSNKNISEKITDRQLQKQSNMLGQRMSFMDGGDTDGTTDGLISAMTQLAWEKDIDLTKGKTFAAPPPSTIKEEVEVACKEREGGGTQLAGRGIKGKNVQGIDNPSLVLNAELKMKGDEKGEQIKLKDVKGSPIVGRGSKVTPEDIAGKPPKPDGSKNIGKEDPKKGKRGGRPPSARSSSGGSKDSAFSEGDKGPLSGRKTAALALSGSRSSLNSASSLTSLLHAWDGKKEKKGSKGQEQSEF